MSNQSDGINFVLLSLLSFDDAGLATKTLDLLLNGLDFINLSNFGTYDPLRDKIPKGDLKPVLESWFCPVDPVTPFSGAGERILRLEGARGRISVMICWGETPSRLNSISCSFPSKHVENVAPCAMFLSWIEKLTACVNPVYGFIQNTMTKGWDTPYNLSVRLPEIPWGTIFGEPYIDLFGESKIEAAPYASVEKWSSGHLFCKLTSNLLDPELPMKLRQEVREFLGEDAFMQGSRAPRHYKTGRAPLALQQNKIGK